MKTFQTVAYSALLLAALASCKKDNDVTDPDGGPGQPAFVGKKWVTQSMTIQPAIDLNGDGKPDSDVTGLLDACDLDDAAVFKADGKLLTDHGAQRCEASEVAEEHTANWTYQKAANTIKLADPTNPSEVTTWEILNQSANTLKIRVELFPADGTGQNIMATVTMKAK
jgi:hypothetical protein